VAIYERLKNDVIFRPSQHKAMKLAYEGTLVDLGITNRADPVTVLIAERLIEYVAFGEDDPAELRKRVVEEFGNASLKVRDL
jgi:hypothetical protein